MRQNYLTRILNHIMRTHLFQLLTQETVFCSTYCSLHCLKCPLEIASLQKKVLNESEHLEQTLHSKINHLPQSKMINIIGGDPILSKHMITTLQTLKKNNHTIRFWTTGVESELVYSQLLPFIDELFLFLPTGDDDNYRELTGRSYLDLLLSRVSFFKDHPISLKINCPVLPLNFPFLPELYDIVYEYKIPLLLHIPTQSELPKDAIHWVKRFKGIDSVTILKTKQTHRNPSCISCPMVPYNNTLSSIQVAYLGWQEYYESLRNKYSMNLILKRHFG